MNTTDIQMTQTPILGRLKRGQQPRCAEGDFVNPKPRRPIMGFKRWLMVQRIKRSLRNRSAQ